MENQGFLIYSKTYCPYCDQAKALLKQRGFEYKEINMSQKTPEDYQKLCLETGMRTVPQIFFDQQLIGGFTDLKAMDDIDQLKRFYK